MIRIILFLLLSLFLISPVSIPMGYSWVYAEEAETSDTGSEDKTPANKETYTPPFPGGPVTSPIGDTAGRNHTHEGADIGIDNVTIVAPCNGYVTHGSGNGFGYGWAYFWTGDRFEGPALRLFFGDLDAATADLPDGPVNQGEPIGYVNGTNPDSTGAHVHVQYYTRDPESVNAPFLHLGDGVEDPVPILQMLGVDLSGKLYTDSMVGSDYDVSFDIEALKTLGNEINAIINDWSDHAIKAIQYITPFALSILGLLCIIDLTLPIILAGMTFDVNSLIVKVLKYAGISALIVLWPDFINNILINFVMTVTSAFHPGLDVTATMTQPQILLQKAIYIISPAFQKINTFGVRDYLHNFSSIIALYVITFLIMGFYMAAAIYIALTYIEFYISAGLCLATVPFTTWTKSKFIPEGTGGHLISCAIKLLFMSILVAMAALAIKDVQPMDLFKMPIGKVSESYTPSTPNRTPIDNKPLDVNSIDNEYVKDIYNIASEMGINPYIALAMAMRESGGDTLEGIHMAENGGIFQILDGNQDCYDPETHETFSVSSRFPNYATDPIENITAAMYILQSKINAAGGDIWKGVKWYNSADPSIGDSEYDKKVASNYTYLTGLPVSLLGSTPITKAMLITYTKIALGMISIAILILILPGRIMAILRGPLELR